MSRFGSIFGLWLGALLCWGCAAPAGAGPQSPVEHFTREGSRAPFSPVVRVGDVLYLSGQIGARSDGSLPEGIEAQTHQAMENVAAALELAGGSMDAVFKCTAMLDNMSDWADFNKVYVSYFEPGTLPARSSFGTDGLALGALVEIECLAHTHEASADSPKAWSHTVQRKGRFGGESIEYRAVVAETFLENPDGTPGASIVSVSYLRTDVREEVERPVVFVFNGGPGSASLWMHMGFVGPRRIDFANDVAPETTPPFHIADNTESPLDVADIVLFDPPGTGFSRTLPAGKAEQYYGVRQDADATVAFIRSWTREHGRWNSPKYLMGESYGTIRAAVVARLLTGGPFATGHMDGITLNGVILLGQAMDSSHSAGDDGELLNALPSLAATAWYHGKVDREEVSLEAHVEAARRFAAGDYQDALHAGWNLDDERRRQIAEHLAALIGIPAGEIVARDLRISNREFSKLLLVDEGMQAGLYDSRFVLPLENDGGDPVADDPAMAQYVPGYVAAVNEYLRGELGVELDRTYHAIEFRSVNARWDYGHGPGIPAARNYAEDLATAARRNPALRIFVGSGYYDLVTTAGSAEYTFAHSGIDPEKVTFRHYESGHMPYLGPDSRRALAEDIRRFIAGDAPAAR